VHSADTVGLQGAGTMAAAAASFESPFSPPPAPLSVAVEEPMFQPDGGRVVTYVTYDDGSASAIDASALVAPVATGVPVWPAAMLAGEAPAAMWRATGSRAVGRRGSSMPSVQLVNTAVEAH
jgi:hypothetical protein